MEYFTRAVITSGASLSTLLYQIHLKPVLYHSILRAYTHDALRQWHGAAPAGMMSLGRFTYITNIHDMSQGVLTTRETRQGDRRSGIAQLFERQNKRIFTSILYAFCYAAALQRNMAIPRNARAGVSVSATKSLRCGIATRRVCIGSNKNLASNKNKYCLRYMEKVITSYKNVC